jgi:hypothetical protein
MARMKKGSVNLSIAEGGEHEETASGCFDSEAENIKSATTKHELPQIIHKLCHPFGVQYVFDDFVFAGVHTPAYGMPPLRG